MQIRCRYGRVGKNIRHFTVQLELWEAGEWRPIVRYDNAHGFCHRDLLHVDGSQEKTPILYGDANETFTKAVADLRANWEAYRSQHFGKGKK